ncbi:MAG: CHASE2 domain-containing protein [Spirochaetaceae bacterium]|nr:MAG: CHASE2 domain-containing protein [Spirochaetaceae bacterium]
MNRIWLVILIPLLVTGAFAALNQLDFYAGAERSVYDLLLHVKPAIPQEESLLFIDIDDTAIAQVGQFPWSRDIMADGLILLKEFQAAYSVFDIEYTEQSPRGVNVSFLNDKIPEIFDQEFAVISQNIRDLFLALQTGMISLRDAEDYVQDLTGLTDMARDVLLDKVREISRDNDTYFGQAARLFGKAYFTVNMLPEVEDAISETHRNYVLGNITRQQIQPAANFVPHPSLVALDIRPAILPILRGADGAGFPNVIVDSDGVRRRIDLVMEYDGHYFAQLAFSPLLDWLGNPTVELRNQRIVLRGAQVGENLRKDIVIPMTENYKFLINWPRSGYMESFRHLGYYTLVLHKRLEEDLMHNLKVMDQAGYLSYFEGDFELLDAHGYADSLLQEVLHGGDPVLMSDYREVRETFFQAVGEYLSGPVEQQILDQVAALLASEEISEEDKVAYREIGQQVPTVFSSTRDLTNELAKVRKTLQEAIPGAFCIIGWTGTSTTDIGVNPFEEEYMNVGTHASLVNTILQGRFLDELPWWYGAALGALLALVITFVIRKLNPLLSILVGIGFLIVLIVSGTGFFLLTGWYLYLLTPALSVFFTLFAVILTKFLLLEKEKSFIRNAFSHYLSTDVINELIADPDKLELGGEKKYLTAMFTDVQGFSSISEDLDPTDLVKLLNAYLTEMSNIILDLKGTIDKYEGDAIIAFFGAPVPFDDHPARACRAAVRMKKIEQHLNEHFVNNRLSPSEVFTRIGINTGEMVVGNMGTQQKMDYTIMGNSVNLASRLEGVNKQYGTWTIISEETYNTGGKDFTVRKMDRVRVVNIKEPVRLYELIDEKSSTDTNTVEAVELFHKGLELFETRQWDAAIAEFRKAQNARPGDGPSEVFIKRCQGFQKKPPPASWDGVFNLSMK